MVPEFDPKLLRLSVGVEDLEVYVQSFPYVTSYLNFFVNQDLKDDLRKGLQDVASKVSCELFPSESWLICCRSALNCEAPHMGRCPVQSIGDRFLFNSTNCMEEAYVKRRVLEPLPHHLRMSREIGSPQSRAPTFY